MERSSAKKELDPRMASHRDNTLQHKERRDVSKASYWDTTAVTNPAQCGCTGQPIKLADQACRSSLPIKLADQPCQPSLPTKLANQACRSSLPIKLAGQGRQRCTRWVSSPACPSSCYRSTGKVWQPANIASDPESPTV